MAKKTSEAKKTYAVAFLEWINNNWFIPTEDGFWKLDSDNIEFENTTGVDDTIFAAEELLGLFEQNKGEF